MEIIPPKKRVSDQGIIEICPGDGPAKSGLPTPQKRHRKVKSNRKIMVNY